MNRKDAIKELEKLRASSSYWRNPDAIAIDMAIKALEAQEWVPCNKRLPYENDYENDHVLVNMCITNTPWNIILLPTAMVREYYKKGYINAWMPLPKPYKAESEK